MTRPHVLVIDAGLGNIGSVVAALQRQDCDVQRLKEPPASQLQHPFTHVVLPGVGAFAAGMHALNSTGWSAWIKNVWLEVIVLVRDLPGYAVAGKPWCGRKSGR